MIQKKVKYYTPVVSLYLHYLFALILLVKTFTFEISELAEFNVQLDTQIIVKTIVSLAHILLITYLLARA